MIGMLYLIDVYKRQLKAIARAGAGVNNIPLDKCSEKGIVVFNTPGANANAVKELVIAGLLLSSRKMAPALSWAQGLKGKGDEVGKLVEKGKSSFVGPEIKGKGLGVIGLGAVSYTHLDVYKRQHIYIQKNYIIFCFSILYMI